MDDATLYLLTRALHVIAFVCWFAGLFYLPRLMVYTTESAAQHTPLLLTMQRKLMVYIMRPAAAATWLFGLLLLVQAPFWLQAGWMHAKLGLVLLLTAYHGTLEILHAGFRRNQNTRSGRWFRVYNEVPTLLLIGIVLLAALKPF